MLYRENALILFDLYTKGFHPYLQGPEDKIERALLSLAADRRAVQGGGEDQKASQSTEWDILAADDWPGITAKAMLLTPSRCRALWRQFTSDTNFVVQQVMQLSVM